MKEGYIRFLTRFRSVFMIAVSLAAGVLAGMALLEYRVLSGTDVLVFALLVIFLKPLLLVSVDLLFLTLRGEKLLVFRYLGFLWRREGDRFRFHRCIWKGVSAGFMTGGKEKYRPVSTLSLFRYSIMNLILSLLSLLLFLLGPKDRAITCLMLFLSLTLLVDTLQRLLPSPGYRLENDMDFFLLQKKHSTFGYYAWKIGRIGVQMAQGITLSEMPDEWFDFPPEQELVHSRGIHFWQLCCDRMMEQGRFDEAAVRLERLLECESNMNASSRCYLRCDLLFCELMTHRRPEYISQLRTQELQNFLKREKSFTSAVRTRYAWHLLWERDYKKASEVRKELDKLEQRAILPGDPAGEKRIMKLAWELGQEEYKRLKENV